MSVLILLDLDGVLADDRHRQHHAIAGRWGAYFAPEAMLADPVWPHGLKLVRETLAERRLASGAVKSGYLTGRREDTRAQSELWLRRHGLPISNLHMKPHPINGVKIPTPLFKAERISLLLKIWDQVTLYDDDPEVCRVVNELYGANTAILCTWHQKPSTMIRLAEV